MFYPYVMISVAQAHENDDLRHVMSPFSLFLSSFSGAQRILGCVSYIRSTGDITSAQALTDARPPSHSSPSGVRVLVVVAGSVMNSNWPPSMSEAAFGRSLISLYDTSLSC